MSVKQKKKAKQNKKKKKKKRLLEIQECFNIALVGFSQVLILQFLNIRGARAIWQSGSAQGTKMPSSTNLIFKGASNESITAKVCWHNQFLWFY